MTWTRRQFLVSAPACALIASPRLTHAQARRDHARLLNGYPAGGGIDAVCRTLAAQMSGIYARTVVVESKPGAAGRLAVEEAKHAAADGSTLLVTPASVLTMYPHIYRQLSYDPFSDLLPLSLLAAFGFALIVGPKVPAVVQTLPDFIAWCKTTPGAAECGNPGAGSFPHFMAMLFARDSGIALTHVPFKGGAAALQDLMGGQVSAALLTEPGAMQYIRTGRVRALATSWSERSRFNPTVPTFQELGFPALTQREWFGAFAPRGTPPAVQQAASTALSDAARSAEIREAWHQLGFAAEGSTPSRLEASLRSEYAFWGPIIRASGFTPES